MELEELIVEIVIGLFLLFTSYQIGIKENIMLPETVTRKIPNGTTIWKKPSRNRKCKHSLQRFARNTPH